MSNDPNTGQPAGPAAPTRLLLDAMGRTRFNRDLHALCAAAEAFRDRLQAFSDRHEFSTVAHELMDAGAFLPEDLARPDVEELLAPVEYATADAAGVLWAVEVFISVAESHAIPLDKGTAAPEPCAIVGAKGGA